MVAISASQSPLQVISVAAQANRQMDIFRRIENRKVTTGKVPPTKSLLQSSASGLQVSISLGQVRSKTSLRMFYSATPCRLLARCAVSAFSPAY